MPKTLEMCRVTRYCQQSEATIRMMGSRTAALCVYLLRSVKSPVCTKFSMYAKMKLRKKQFPSPRARRMDLYMASSFLILARNTELPDWYSAMSPHCWQPWHLGVIDRSADHRANQRSYLAARQVWAQGHPQRVFFPLLACIEGNLCVCTQGDICVVSVQPVCYFQHDCCRLCSTPDLVFLSNDLVICGPGAVLLICRWCRGCFRLMGWV